MPLVHLLFRCPTCGHDPLEGRDDQAVCTACGTEYLRDGPGARILVRAPGQGSRRVPAWELSRTMGEQGGAAGGLPRRDGSLHYSARVTARRLVAEAAVRFGGGLLGFAERSTPEEGGILTVTGETLTYEPEGDADAESWDLLDIRAVQTSSRSVQIRTSDGQLVQFEFPEDSPRRWDELLRALIEDLWRRAGRGEITEFQPRITTR